MDEKSLRKWAAERIGLLAQITAGQRDEESRRMLALYVDEIRIDPATKTGVFILNAHIAGFAGSGMVEEDGVEAGGEGGAEPGASSSLTAGEDLRSPQNDRDPPCSGSQVNQVAGAGFGSRLRPRRPVQIGFRFGGEGVRTAA